MNEYLNREQRRKYFKKNRKKVGTTWDEFNATFVKKAQYRKEENEKMS